MSGFEESIGHRLLDLYLLSTILLAAACLANSLLRQPARRLAVGWGAAAGLAVLALFPLLPGWPRLGLVRPEAPAAPASSAIAGEDSRSPGADRNRSPAGAPAPAVRPIAPTVPSTSELAAEPARTPAPAAASYGWSLSPVFLFVAFAGVLAAWLFLGALATLRIARRAERAPTPLGEFLAGIAGNRRRPPRLQVSGHLDRPACMGLWRPRIVLPKGFVESLRPAEIEAVILHEWDHIRRGDLWLLALGRWLMVLFFAHPLFWWMRRKIHLDQEVLADAAASGRTGPIDYAESLVRWCQARRRMPFAFAGSSISARRGRILLRVKMLLEGKLAIEPRCPAALRLGAFGLATAGAFILSIWTLHPGAAAVRAAAPEGDPVADLVRQVYKDGSWTAESSSFFLRSEYIQTVDPREGEADLPEPEPRRPAKAPSKAKPPEESTTGAPAATAAPDDVTPASKGSTTRSIFEIGFDRKRLWSGLRSEDGSGTTEVHLWDGKEGKEYLRTASYEACELSNDTGQWGFIDFWGIHQWANIGAYSFWWRPWDVQGFLSANGLLPEDFKSVGREVFAGTECLVVESKAGFTRLYIGAADRRLRGKTYYVTRDGVDHMKLIRAIAGEKIESIPQWKSWLKTLDPMERRRAEKRLVESYPDADRRKYFEYTFDDYRQLAPGRWVPWKVREDIYDVHSKRSRVSSIVKSAILELKVDRPLPDDLFKLDQKPGVNVADFRFDLPEAQPLRYTFEPGRTEADVQALHEAERKSLEKLRKGFVGLTAGVAARVGQRPCEFPESTWFNSKPLAWKDLLGKVVVLEFWATDCGASLGDFQVFGKDFKTFTDAGVTIIGVHTATKNPKDVEKAIESRKISIPICIDAPGPEGKPVGSMTSWFGIDGAGGKMFPFLGGNGVIRIPYTVIVGKDGRVAGHGYLWDMLNKAREMAGSN